MKTPAALLLLALVPTAHVAAFTPLLQGMRTAQPALRSPSPAMNKANFAGFASRVQPASLAAQSQGTVGGGSGSSLLASVAAFFRAIIAKAFVLAAVAIFGLQAVIGMRDITSQKVAAGGAAAVPVESVAKAELAGSRSKEMLAITVGSSVGLIANGYFTAARLGKTSRRRG